MTKIALALLVGAAVALSSAAFAENPFESQEFLRESLAQFDFEDRVYLKLRRTNEGFDELAFPLSGHDFGLTEVDEFLVIVGLFQYQPVIDGEDVDAGLVWRERGFDPDNFQRFLSAESISIGEEAIEIEFSNSVIDSRSLEFNEWSEGNVEYAMARGSYSYTARPC